MQKLNRRQALAAGVATFAVAAAGAPGPAVAADTVKIGLPISLTGALADEARITTDGYKFWADDVNRRGGLAVDDKKYKVDLIIYDDQSSVDQGAQLTQRLIVQDKVDFLFSPYGSGPVYAASAVSERYHKLMLNGGGTAPAIFSRGFKYFFSPTTTTNLYPKGVFDLIPTLNPRPKTIAVLWKNDLADRAMNQDTEKFSKEVGLQVVYNKDFSADATDFTTEMAVIRATNPDIVFFLSQLPQFVTAIREMKEQHLQPKIVWNGIAVPQPTFPSTAGPDSEGILGVSSWVSTLHYKDPIWGDTAGFVKAFEAYKKYTPDYHVAVAAAGAEMLELAVRAAHSLDTEKVRAALAALDVETFWGHIHVDETGKNAQMLITGQIQNGKFVPIYPPSAAQGTLKYPKPAW